VVCLEVLYLAGADGSSKTSPWLENMCLLILRCWGEAEIKMKAYCCQNSRTTAKYWLEHTVRERRMLSLLMTREGGV